MARFAPRSRFRTLVSGFITLECALLLAAALATSGAVALGLSPLAITSGSMEPTIAVGSLVWADRTPAEQLMPGDICAFSSPDGITVVHRVESVDTADTSLITKGDANAGVDPRPIPFASVQGKVVFALPVAGALFLAVQTHRGLFVLVLIGINGALAAAAAAVSTYHSLKGEQNGENREEAERAAEVPARLGQGGSHHHRLRPHFRRSGHGLLHR
ncbi:MAG: signal peptidase I [Eggerthellaceae bacterium]|nr:signal peptidase I [Eggerthellaceae bacterium]